MQGQSTGWGLWLATRAGELEPLVVEQGDQWWSAFSPDGGWCCYATGIAGTNSGLFVMPFADRNGGPIRIPGTPNRVAKPAWSRDGKELYYVDDGGLKVMPVTTSPALSFGKPAEVCANAWITGSIGGVYAPMPDGQRVLLIREDPAYRPGQDINMVLNWREDLKATMGE